MSARIRSRRSGSFFVAFAIEPALVEEGYRRFCFDLVTLALTLRTTSARSVLCRLLGSFVALPALAEAAQVDDFAHVFTVCAGCPNVSLLKEGATQQGQWGGTLEVGKVLAKL